MNAQPTSGEHTADSAVYRAALRREKLAARLALDPAAFAVRNAAIETRLDGFLSPRPPQTLAFCAPVRNEFDARALVGRLLGKGWRAAMPVVVEPAAPMRFRAWTPESEMVADRHGIPVPAAGVELVPDIVLLPLVAFDARGFRLGYGGGYFDRTLAALVPRPLAVGIGFELARCADIRPQAHDLPLDAVVTEDGVERHTA